MPYSILCFNISILLAVVLLNTVENPPLPKRGGRGEGDFGSLVNNSQSFKGETIGKPCGKPQGTIMFKRRSGLLSANAHS